MGRWLGFDEDPGQRLFLDAVFAEDAAGLPACFEVAYVGPRQTTGKTAALQTTACQWLFTEGLEKIIWTAHLYDTALEAHASMVRRIGANPDLRALCKWPPPSARGAEAIRLKTGEQIEFHARSTGGGRGLTGDKVIFDEALFLKPNEVGAVVPTMATRRDAQVVYAGSAGLLQSEVLRGIRDRGRAGGATSLAYLEWCAERAECDNPLCSHAVGMPGCALDRRELWWAANAGLAMGRSTEDMLAKFRAAMPPAEFAREFLGWWDDPASPGGAISSEDWAGCLAHESVPAGPVVLGFEVSHRRDWSAIVAAAPSTITGTHVEITGRDAGLDYRPGTGWLVDRLVELRDRQRPVRIVCNASGPAGGLLADCRKAGLEVVEASSADYVKACGAAFDDITGRRWRHIGQPALNVAVGGAAKRVAGDAFVFDRRGDVDISPLVAAALAALHARDGAESIYEGRGLVTL